MKKEEAIQAMKEGKKVTHRYFDAGEWMTMQGGKIVLEDGVKCSPDLFWSDRKGENWESDYELFEN